MNKLILAFTSIPTASGAVYGYKIWLLNTAACPLIIDYDMSFTESAPIKFQGKLEAGQSEEVGQIVYDQLNELPQCVISYHILTTNGLENGKEQVLKLKAKRFFKAPVMAPIIDEAATLFEVFTKIESGTSNTAPGNLKAYTDNNLKENEEKKEQDAGELLWKPVRDLERRASFNTELDLHIEKLVDSASKLSNADCLNLQLRVFDEYLSEAVKHGIDRVFIIHGLGKGVLRQRIASKLRDHPYVKSFKNEYHGKYGFGATEVIID